MATGNLFIKVAKVYDINCGVPEMANNTLFLDSLVTVCIVNIDKSVKFHICKRT